jgi:hypothetical protein
MEMTVELRMMVRALDLEGLTQARIDKQIANFPTDENDDDEDDLDEDDFPFGEEYISPCR